MKCPICKQEGIHGGMAEHFMFVHQLTTGGVINIIFEEIHKLNDRVTNLCELLEVTEG